VCVCVCACACVYVCVRVCMCVCADACVCSVFCVIIIKEQLSICKHQHLSASTNTYLQAPTPTCKYQHLSQQTSASTNTYHSKHLQAPTPITAKNTYHSKSLHASLLCIWVPSVCMLACQVLIVCGMLSLFIAY